MGERRIPSIAEVLKREGLDDRIKPNHEEIDRMFPKQTIEGGMSEPTQEIRLATQRLYEESRKLVHGQEGWDHWYVSIQHELTQIVDQQRDALKAKLDAVKCCNCCGKDLDWIDAEDFPGFLKCTQCDSNDCKRLEKEMDQVEALKAELAEANKERDVAESVAWDLQKALDAAEARVGQLTQEHETAFAKQFEEYNTEMQKLLKRLAQVERERDEQKRRADLSAVVVEEKRERLAQVEAELNAERVLSGQALDRVAQVERDLECEIQRAADYYDRLRKVERERANYREAAEQQHDIVQEQRDQISKLEGALRKAQEWAAGFPLGGSMDTVAAGEVYRECAALLTPANSQEEK